MHLTSFFISRVNGRFATRISLLRLVLVFGLAHNCLISSVRSEGSYVCPTNCSCSSNGLEVECHRALWPPLPSVAAQRVVSLTITGLKLKSLEATGLRNFKTLETLSLTDGYISEISIGTFSNLVQLETLNLSTNQLTKIPAYAFKNNERLTTLILSRNQLELPTGGPFLYCESLQLLDLSQCGLPSLHEDVFSGLSSLRLLYLHDNLFTKYPSDALSRLTELQELWYDDNLPNGETQPENQFPSLRHIIYISCMTAAIVCVLILGHTTMRLMCERCQHRRKLVGVEATPDSVTQEVQDENQHEYETVDYTIPGGTQRYVFLPLRPSDSTQRPAPPYRSRSDIFDDEDPSFYLDDPDWPQPLMSRPLPRPPAAATWNSRVGQKADFRRSDPPPYEAAFPDKA